MSHGQSIFFKIFLFMNQAFLDSFDFKIQTFACDSLNKKIIGINK